ncbi:hypothetical protein ACFWMX_30955 [Streptomyces sp. NPDC058378]|uniref:hypothetical protein n=1 Tax=Streptomyces sp. NPDC058378 TaxID=3346469 RepID=UPI00366501D8
MTEDKGDSTTIAARCRAEGGLMEVNLGDLREELGYKKLGKWVLVEVAEALGRDKLGYFPEGMLDPQHNTVPRQAQTVWIYENDGGLRAQVISAVLHPDRRDVRAALDALVDHGEALTSEQKLDRIRDLVGS